jgi:hypothetical protein
MAAIMADPQSRAADLRLPTMNRRMGVVTDVQSLPGFPLTADVEVNNATVPGCSPQSTYRPVVGDLVWLEFLGADPHISPPLTTNDNRRWRSLVLINGWTGSPPGYWRDTEGVVHIKNAIAGGAVGSVFGNLPANYRPDITERVFAVPYLSSGGASFVAGAVVVRTNGNMEWHGPISPSVAYLDGITFRID